MTKLSQIVLPTNLVTRNDNQTLTDKVIDFEDNSLIGVASTSTAQTLTNKTIGISENNLTGVQPELVNSVNIKSVNGNSLLGSGDLEIRTDQLTGEVFVDGSVTQEYKEVQEIGGLITLDLEESNYFKFEVDGNVTINLINPKSRGQQITCAFEYKSGLITWSSDIDWLFETTPEVEIGLNVLQFLTYPSDETVTPEGQRTFFDDENIFRVPRGVTSLSALVVGGGGGGMSNTGGGSGGGGGDLRWATSIAVTPGELLTIEVGQGGFGGGDPSSGGVTRILRGATTLLSAAGGGAGRVANTTGPKNGLSTAIDLVNGIGGGDGGVANVATTHTSSSGGGGAGGYSGDGGNGSTGAVDAADGSGGGGAGGRGTGSAGSAGAGGGVGLLGEGTSGLAGTTASAGGGGGSGGEDGATGASPDGGGLYGGGGGGRDNATAGTFSPGAPGAVRLIWGPGRAYPSTSTGDVAPVRLYAKILGFTSSVFGA